MSTEVSAAGEHSKESRLGKRPIPIPKGVTVEIGSSKIGVQGPKGKLENNIPPTVSVRKEGDVLVVKSSASGRDAPRWQGLCRALLANMVRGASEGYEKVLELVGTGYRAELKGKTLTMSVGLSHQVIYDLPAAITATIPADSKGTILILNSADKALLGQVAATLRSYRPPEPYAGKGVRYRGEQIRRKAGKAGKK
jgi:large subunit ribosomal protein L6